MRAEASNSSGAVISGVSFTWTSSASNVASVDDSGLVTGLAEGRAIIIASAAGRHDSLGMRVVAADLTVVSQLLNDRFTDSLVTYLSSAIRPTVALTLDSCDQGLVSGNVLSVDRGLSLIRNTLATASTPDDSVLAAVLVLIVDYADLKLGL